MCLLVKQSTSAQIFACRDRTRGEQCFLPSSSVCPNAPCFCRTRLRYLFYASHDLCPPRRSQPRLKPSAKRLLQCIFPNTRSVRAGRCSFAAPLAADIDDAAFCLAASKRSTAYSADEETPLRPILPPASFGTLCLHRLPHLFRYDRPFASPKGVLLLVRHAPALARQIVAGLGGASDEHHQSGFDSTCRTLLSPNRCPLFVSTPSVCSSLAICLLPHPSSAS